MPNKDDEAEGASGFKRDMIMFGLSCVAVVVITLVVVWVAYS